MFARLAILAALVPSALGCAPRSISRVETSPMPPSVVQQHHIAALHWYAALQSKQLEMQQRELEHNRRYEQQLESLEELVGLNQKLSERLEAAEDALEELRELDRQADGPQRFTLAAEEQLERMRALRAHNAARAQVHQQLIDNLQALVDTGIIHVRIDDAGRARFASPRLLDNRDPWRPAAD